MSTPQNTYKVIGLMSGTSLDGLDIAYCHFHKKESAWEFSILKTESIEYTPDYKEQLKNIIHLQAIELLAFHNTYGNWLGNTVNDFIKKNKMAVDFISSHGHTVHHQPKIGVTYQIGSGQHLANTSKKKVICDFRTNDVSLGGQGAPLVPIGDKLLFSTYDFCLNLGGISNISFDNKEKRIAYDISPANMLLNHICKRIDIPYDDGGKLSRTGTLNHKLLDTINRLEYYSQAYPKSLGYEWFTEKIIPVLEYTNDTPENLLHTSVHHIAQQIAIAIKKTNKKKASLLITGGGAKNHFLVEILKNNIQEYVEVIIPEEKIIDFKEALIFAFMGVLKERNEINCLSSVTGAIRDSCSGVIYTPQ